MTRMSILEAAVDEQVRRRFGVAIARLEPVTGGLDDRARVWCATDDSGALWSVKATRRDGRFGLSLAASLADAGVPGVIAPLRADDGRPWTEDDGVLVSVAPWILGEDAVDSGPDALSWEGLGVVLRAVHDSEPPAGAPVRRGIRRADAPPLARLADLDERMHAVQDHAVARLWRAHRPRLEALARAERRLKRERTPTTRVPLHGDPHPGNVVIGVDGRPWLIDFDEATVAPREVDLLLIELGVIFSQPISDEQRRAFRSGYGATAIDDSRIARFGCVRAIEDAAATAHAALDSEDPGEARESLESLEGQLGPHGLVSLVETALDRLDP